MEGTHIELTNIGFQIASANPDHSITQPISQWSSGTKKSVYRDNHLRAFSSALDRQAIAAGGQIGG
jgi:hypothetical protein